MTRVMSTPPQVERTTKTDAKPADKTVNEVKKSTNPEQTAPKIEEGKVLTKKVEPIIEAPKVEKTT